MVIHRCDGRFRQERATLKTLSRKTSYNHCVTPEELTLHKFIFVIIDSGRGGEAHCCLQVDTNGFTAILDLIGLFCVIVAPCCASRECKPSEHEPVGQRSPGATENLRAEFYSVPSVKCTVTLTYILCKQSVCTVQFVSNPLYTHRRQ